MRSREDDVPSDRVDRRGRAEARELVGRGVDRQGLVRVRGEPAPEGFQLDVSREERWDRRRGRVRRRRRRRRGRRRRAAQARRNARRRRRRRRRRRSSRIRRRRDRGGPVDDGDGDPIARADGERHHELRRQQRVDVRADALRDGDALHDRAVDFRGRRRVAEAGPRRHGRDRDGAAAASAAPGSTRVVENVVVVVVVVVVRELGPTCRRPRRGAVLARRRATAPVVAARGALLARHRERRLSL